MATNFFASQSVHIAVQQQAIPIQYYLRQPQRLVNALADSSRIEQLRRDIFRLKMRPLHFMSTSIQPTVDMRVWSESDGTLKLQSINCEIRGLDYINQRFSLSLIGYLTPILDKTGTNLKGRADLTVQVELPLPFSLTPKPIIEKAGNGLLKSVLLTVKQRLLNQLLADYQKWVITQTSQTNFDSNDADYRMLNPE
ncbi:MAG: DUF1997 domain-containing protein [Cyanobacteria bacterium P01_A01_bin.45]